mmetsp:Transcript_3791/g.9366  ORF Transcript_3791/g.9366 Transcript_3791/m.9366 type:complete len:204 (-) Transcript_3791:115-726(-)
MRFRSARPQLSSCPCQWEDLSLRSSVRSTSQRNGRPVTSTPSCLSRGSTAAPLLPSSRSSPASGGRSSRGSSSPSASRRQGLLPACHGFFLPIESSPATGFGYAPSQRTSRLLSSPRLSSWLEHSSQLTGREPLPRSRVKLWRPTSRRSASSAPNFRPSRRWSGAATTSEALLTRPASASATGRCSQRVCQPAWNGRKCNECR